MDADLGEVELDPITTTKQHDARIKFTAAEQFVRLKQFRYSHMS